MHWISAVFYILVLTQAPAKEPIPIHVQLVHSPTEAAIVAAQWQKSLAIAQSGMEAHLYRVERTATYSNRPPDLGLVPVPLPQLQEISAHAGKTFVVTDIPMDTLTVKTGGR